MKPASLDSVPGTLAAEVDRFISVLDHRIAAGWMKVPTRELERLRAARDAERAGVQQ